ncbi:hypothetical protein CI109_104278 [Kwoniella shandongensis]|uniref:Enhancer of mRNA-decapping protein 4 WD40 repeat region domain-containing protein n=1 Tax=Kwoniella shandongensis TaxID=1734106 RepID=A0AAJ8LMH3_9TREE
MEQQNRLLQMLNSATSPPPPPSSQHTPIPTQQAQTHLFPPGGGVQIGSPREPSPTPPPPSLQAISLNDLFKNISSPLAQPESIPTASPPLQKEDHKTSLLGMLKNIGSTTPGGSGITSPSVASGASSPGVGQHRHDGPRVGVSSPQAPVINHPGGFTSPPPPAPQQANTAPSDLTAQTAKTDIGKSPEPPKRSMFDFVSPFDVFEKPRQPSSSKPPAPAPKAPQEEVKDVKPKISEETKPAVAKVKKAENGSRTASPQRKQAESPAPETTYVSGALIGQPPVHELSSDAIGSAVDATWQVSKVTKGEEGKGPRALTPHTSIDLSKPNLGGLVNTAGSVRITPTTLMRTDNLDFKQGRRVATTSTFLAYTMSKGVGGPLGRLMKVEWVRRENRDYLAIGGTEGVLLIDPGYLGSPDVLSNLTDIAATNKILKTDGPVVDFCLNHTHQAIGILSSTSQFTLYNVANLNRVWHRPLPTLSPEVSATSVQFCESNILVGRGNDTLFELVQITVDMAVLSTIKFTSPSPSPENLHYAHAVYDSAKSTLWIAPFARSSLFAFKYGLKGQQPIKDVSSVEGQKVVAFEKVAEFPLDPVLSLAISKKEAQEDAEIFYATPSGFSQATVSKAALEAQPSPFAEVAKSATPAPVPAPSVPAPAKPASVAPSPKVQATEFKKPGKAATPAKTSSKNASPAVVKTELVSASEDDTPSQPRAKKATKNAVAGPATMEPNVVEGTALSADEFTKTLKKTEDRMSNHFKQVLKNEVTALNARFDGLTGPDFAADISAKVERQLKGALTTAVAQEVKKSIVPSLTATIQNEVRTVVANQVPAAIFDVLQSVPKELERGLSSTIQRTVSSVIQASMDRAIQESIQHNLMPAIQVAGSTLTDQLMTELKSEMLQIRKELSPAPAPAQTNNDQVLRTMATSISELQKQLAALSEQFARVSNAPIQAPHLNGGHPQLPPPPPPVAQPAPPPPAPAPAPGISPAQLEDIFLSALGNQSTQSTLVLVGQQAHLVDLCLPIQPGAKSPLSQAVLLTLLHRLAIALNDVPPNHIMFPQLVSWTRRTSALVDPRDSNIAGYISRVLQVVQGTLNQVINNLQSRFGAEPTTAGQIGTIRQTLDIVGHKLASV